MARQVNKVMQASTLTGLLSRTVATVGIVYRGRAGARARMREECGAQWGLSRRFATVASPATSSWQRFASTPDTVAVLRSGTVQCQLGQTCRPARGKHPAAGDRFPSFDHLKSAFQGPSAGSNLQRRNRA